MAAGGAAPLSGLLERLPHPPDDSRGGGGTAERGSDGEGHTAGAPPSVRPVGAHNGTERRAVREESNLGAMTNGHGDAVAERHKCDPADLPPEAT